jgi:hypothetical protein
MRRAVWLFAWAAVVVWSLVAWGAHGLLGMFGDVAVRNADVVTGDPETVEFLAWGLATLRDLGLVAVLLVWGFVSLLILAAAALFSRLVGQRSPVHERTQWQRTVRTAPREVAPSRPGDRSGPPAAVRDVMRRIEERR